MSKYLTSTMEIYRIDTEEEVNKTLEDFKQEGIYEVKKTSYEKKEIKEKGEVVDEFYLLTVKKVFNDPKYPNTSINIIYEGEN